MVETIIVELGIGKVEECVVVRREDSNASGVLVIVTPDVFCVIR